MQKTFVLRFKNLKLGGKTRALRRQNSRHMAAKTYTKRQQTCGKRLYCALKKNFPAHQKICTAHQKNFICTTAKN